MEAPGSFILLAIVLMLILVGCIALGIAVWYFGRRTRKAAIQWLSILPVGFGLFIVGPLLLLSVVLVFFWRIATGFTMDP